MTNARTNSKIRYAVVGLGHIAQSEVLPAFEHAETAELAALVSGDLTKARAVGEQYGLKHIYGYDDYEKCLKEAAIDAVYIAVPNDRHSEFTRRAATAGVHVLCEKPMAVTSEECAEMIDACEEHEVKLMIGYRLHFEAANLHAIEIANSGQLGELRHFDSVYSMQVRPGNIRVKKERGGGSVYDIGIYCINAARYIFQSEPTEVIAWEGTNGDARFQEVDEMMSVIMRFPGERLATFTCSFNGAGVQFYNIMGTKGSLRVDPAYDYAMDLQHHLQIGGEVKTTSFPKRDQFAPELAYFASCILKDCDPEPDGWEGLQDVKTIESIYKSARSSAPVKLQAFQRNKRRADLSQEIEKPPAESKPELVGVQAPTIDQ